MAHARDLYIKRVPSFSIIKSENRCRGPAPNRIKKTRISNAKIRLPVIFIFLPRAYPWQKQTRRGALLRLGSGMWSNAHSPQSSRLIRARNYVKYPFTRHYRPWYAFLSLFYDVFLRDRGKAIILFISFSSIFFLFFSLSRWETNSFDFLHFCSTAITKFRHQIMQSLACIFNTTFVNYSRLR